jgi:hypothetical protein
MYALVTIEGKWNETGCDTTRIEKVGVQAIVEQK